MKQTTPTDDGDDELEFKNPEHSLVSIATQGDPMRSFIDTIRALDDEARLTFTDDGIDVSLVDPANVLMLDLFWPQNGPSSYSLDGTDVAVGINLERLSKVLKYARRGRGNNDGDPVRLDVVDDPTNTRQRIIVQTIRPDNGIIRSTEFYVISPKKMRKEPELPELSLDYRADPAPSTLNDALDGLGQTADYSYILADQGDLLLTNTEKSPDQLFDSEDIDLDDTVRVPNQTWHIEDGQGDIGNHDGSLFSLSYLEPVAETIDSDAEADKLTIAFDVDFPVQLQFENSDWGFDGTFSLAPRIQRRK